MCWAFLIEYRLTESGKNLANVIDSMIDWGITHRAQEVKSKQGVAVHQLTEQAYSIAGKDGKEQG